MRTSPKGRRALLLAVLALAIGSTWGLPAAADLSFSVGDTARVNATDGDGLNLRAAPGLESAIIAGLPEDSALAIEDGPAWADDGSGWYLVSADAGDGWLTGWVAADYVGGDWSAVVSWGEVPEAPDGLPAGVPLWVDAGGEGLALRAAPSLDAELLAGVPEGDAVEVLDVAVYDVEGTAWSPIRWSGVEGYARSAYLGLPIAVGDNIGNAAGDALVSEALAWIGTPYLWGGTTPEGFDCSGFTWYVITQVLWDGYPRPMEDQVISGYEVAPEELQPGDVVYFQNTYQWGLSHVGFYIGGGLFVNAGGEHGGVGISSLWDPYWQARYVTARRVS